MPHNPRPDAYDLAYVREAAEHNAHTEARLWIADWFDSRFDELHTEECKPSNCFQIIRDALRAVQLEQMRIGEMPSALFDLRARLWEALKCAAEEEGWFDALADFKSAL